MDQNCINEENHDAEVVRVQERAQQARILMQAAQREADYSLNNVLAYRHNQAVADGVVAEMGHRRAMMRANVNTLTGNADAEDVRHLEGQLRRAQEQLRAAIEETDSAEYDLHCCTGRHELMVALHEVCMGCLRCIRCLFCQKPLN